MTFWERTSRTLLILWFKKINYRWIDNEFECYDGELRIILPWKLQSVKSSLKEVSYKFIVIFFCQKKDKEIKKFFANSSNIEGPNVNV